MASPIIAQSVIDDLVGASRYFGILRGQDSEIKQTNIHRCWTVSLKIARVSLQFRQISRLPEGPIIVERVRKWDPVPLQNVMIQVDCTGGKVFHFIQ